MTKKPNIHYIHYLSQTAKERLVGGFFILSLFIIAGLVGMKVKSSNIFDEVITYHTHMQSAQGISLETLVNISGIEAGKVSSIEITDDNSIHIQFFIYKRFEKLIRTDSKGVLSKLSLIGNSVIMITAGKSSLPLLPSGAEIIIDEPITTNDLMEGMLPVINDLDSIASYLSDIIAVIEPDSIEASTESIKTILADIEGMTAHISSGQGLVGKALYDTQQAEKVTESLNSTAASLAGVEQRVTEIEPLINSLTALADESGQLIIDMRASLKKIDAELEHLPEIINNAETLLQSTGETVQGVQKIWPLSTVMPQPSKVLVIDGDSLHD